MRALQTCAAAAALAALVSGCRESPGSAAPAAEPAPPALAAPAETSAPAPAPTPEATIPPVAQPEPDPARLREAIARVEAPRFSRVRLRITPELRLYDDTRRFLAIQIADSRAHGDRLPADDADLAAMVLRRELVELPALTDDYVLYDLGIDVSEDPRLHYDPATGVEVPILASLDELAAERARLTKAARKPGRLARKMRRELGAMNAAYEDPALRQRLFAEHEALTAVASAWELDLEQPAGRERFLARIVRCVRPDTRAVLEEIARGYRQRFDRRLPVSSLVRTLRYQERLRRVNRNATRIEVPPHTTGMAFDISYRYMATDEQNHLVIELARLKVGGRIEALRERNNSFHVYVLRKGLPPEAAIEANLDAVEEARQRPARRTRRSR